MCVCVCVFNCVVVRNAVGALPVLVSVIVCECVICACNWLCVGWCPVCV